MKSRPSYHIGGRNLTAHSTWDLITKHSVVICFFALGLAIVVNSICHATPPRGGGKTTPNNVNITLDETTGVLSITGDGAANMLYVSVFYTGIRISPGPWNQTTINGGVGDFVFYFYPVSDVYLNVDLAGGNDRLWMNVQDNTNTYSVSTLVKVGDGADEIALFGAADQNVALNGVLTIFGGKGDDNISFDNVDAMSSLEVSGDDGNDYVSVSNVIASASATFNGGRGRDTLTQLNFLPFYGASISGFETLIGQ